jgi:hypothetical protein
MPSSSPDLANVMEWLSLQTAAQAAAQAEAFRQLQLETERQLQEQRLTFQRLNLYSVHLKSIKS